MTKSDQNIFEAACPACSHNIAVPFLDNLPQPLATLGWPSSASNARNMKRLPVNFVCCVECSHVFNPEFSYEEVPYSEKPNLMFNRGAIWSEFLARMRDQILQCLPADPVVVEVGHGDGSFLAGLAEACPNGRFYGFDPHGATPEIEHICFRSELFIPEQHLQELKPDMVISRHVLEHLISPLSFLQRLSFAAASLGQKPLAYFETPCIDRVRETARTVDFYYEHSSQFSSRSFERMLESCDADILEIGHGYDGEVIYGFVRLGVDESLLETASEASCFHADTSASKAHICSQLSEMHAAGKSLAVWGGTGKAAAFIGRYELDAERFPVIVDSDIDKAGTFVPGTGQEICYRDYLLENPVDIVIVPPQWRARDIANEIDSVGISIEKILIEHDGKLIDFLRDAHPYG